MKKTILLTILALFIFLVSANAECLLPHGIAGTVTMEGASPEATVFKILFENINFGGTLETTTNNKGYYQQDLANLPNCYISGNDIRVSIKECSLSVCSKTIKVSGGKNVGINFNLPVGAVELKYVCWDNSLVDNLVDCPIQPVTIVEKEPNLEAEADSAKITLFYGQEINLVIGDSKLSKLQDKEIEFNDKDYDIKEELTIKGKILTSLDDEDFGDKPYLTFKEGDIVYKYIFEKAIPKSEVTEDEPLKINLLGKEVEIVSLKDDEFTLISGKHAWLSTGEEKDGIKLDSVSSNNKALIYYKGEFKSVEEGEIVKIQGLEIYVSDVIDNELNDKIEIKYGVDVKLTIKDGDDYNDEDVFKWLVTSDSIGITNQEDYDDIDEDSDYKSITMGESISFPNFQIKFSETTSPKVAELKIKVKDSALYISSAENTFSFGTEEYDRIYVKETGFYDKDSVLITSTGKIKIADGDNYLELGSLKIGKLTISFDMSDILYNGVSFAGKEDIYLDYLGFIFNDPKQAIEDKNGFVVKVPEERPEAVLLISVREVEVEQPKVVPIIPEEVVTPEPVTPVTPSEPEVTPAETVITPTPEEIPETKEPEQTVWDALLDALVKILAVFGFGAGFIALLRYWWKKDPKRAIKMAKTAFMRVVLGQYDKYKKQEKK